MTTWWWRNPWVVTAAAAPPPPSVLAGGKSSLRTPDTDSLRTTRMLLVGTLTTNPSLSSPGWARLNSSGTPRVPFTSSWSTRRFPPSTSGPRPPTPPLRRPSPGSRPSAWTSPSTVTTMPGLVLVYRQNIFKISFIKISIKIFLQNIIKIFSRCGRGGEVSDGRLSWRWQVVDSHWSRESLPHWLGDLPGTEEK